MHLPEIIYFDIKKGLHLEIVEKIQDGTIKERVPFLVEYYWLELQENNTIIELAKNLEKPYIVIDVLVTQVNEELKRNTLKAKEEVNIHFTPSNLNRLIEEYLSRTTV